MGADATATPTMNDIWNEGLASALESVGAWDAYESLTPDQRAGASTYLSNWAECMDMGGPDTPDPSIAEIAGIRAQHQREIADLNRQIDAYRQSVATRRGVPLSDVFLNRHNEVIYGKA
jgi:hypothetical protein